MSLDGTYDSDNMFAKIMQGSIPCAKVYEDEDVFSFMDVFPQSSGHTLVIPKCGARNLLDTDEMEVVHAIKAVRRVAQAVKTAMKPDGITVLQYNGAPAGQSVFHLHFHIIPRYEGRDLAGHGHNQMADLDELTAQAAKIAAAL